MSFYPDFTARGYKIEAELGRNREGGRITWKGIDLSTQQTVVIKQFCFAKAGSSWSGYKAYEREIDVLQKLNHPHIPKYLNCLETPDGFCLVQTYIAATPLADFRPLTVPEVKQIALKILDILIYLQQQKPPILHCDLKPENILLDRDLNAYLIDFGLASLGSKEVTGSSVFKGTPGFIAPEQIIQPTMASDIYSLGIVLVCVLANKDITKIRNFASADDPYQLNLNTLLPQIERQFLKWLEKMTHAKVSQRFPNALAAKQALLELLPTTTIVKADESALLPTNTWFPQVCSGTVAIFGLSTVAVWGISFATDRFELTTIKLAIAILTTVAVGVSELGAIALINWDRQAKIQGIALAILVPIALVAASGLIYGMGEAVIISAAIAVTELLLVAYFWWQIPGLQSALKVSLGLGAPIVGIILGCQLM